MHPHTGGCLQLVRENNGASCWESPSDHEVGAIG
jgi:hypothetical protein